MRVKVRPGAHPVTWVPAPPALTRESGICSYELASEGGFFPPQIAYPFHYFTHEVSFFRTHVYLLMIYVLF